MIKSLFLLLLVLGTMCAFLFKTEPCLATEVYWCEGDWSSGTLYKANSDGSGRQVLSSSTTEAYSAIALDLGSSQIYWTGDNKIRRSNLDGSNIEELVSGNFFSEGLALDIENAKMYWTDYDGRIQRANMDGSNSEILLDRSERTYGIAIDVAGSKMYWSERDTGSFQNSIWRCGLDGTGVEKLLDGGEEPLGIALDLTANKIYWADWQGQKIHMANMDGTDWEVIYTSTQGNPTGITLDTDAGKIYWSEWNTKSILRADMDGSNVEVLFTTIENPWGIAVPEPATLLLFTLGSILARRKRRG